MIWVYSIPAFAPDLSCHVYVGHSKHTRIITRIEKEHRKDHEAGKHPNIPAHYSVMWEDVRITGPFGGTPEEVTQGAEQDCYDFWRQHFPMLNKLPPKHTTRGDFATEGARRGGKISGKVNIKNLTRENRVRGGRRNVESGHLKRIASLGGRAAVESGHLKRIASIGGKIAAVRLNTHPDHATWSRRGGKIGGKIAAVRLNTHPDHAAWVRRGVAHRCGTEVEPGLWESKRYPGKILLDERTI